MPADRSAFLMWGLKSPKWVPHTSSPVKVLCRSTLGTCPAPNGQESNQRTQATGVSAAAAVRTTARWVRKVRELVPSIGEASASRTRSRGLAGERRPHLQTREGLAKAEPLGMESTCSQASHFPPTKWPAGTRNTGLCSNAPRQAGCRENRPARPQRLLTDSRSMRRMGQLPASRAEATNRGATREVTAHA